MPEHAIFLLDTSLLLLFRVPGAQQTGGGMLNPRKSIEKIVSFSRLAEKPQQWSDFISILYKYSKDVSREFDEFRVNTSLAFLGGNVTSVIPIRVHSRGRRRVVRRLTYSLPLVRRLA